MIFFSTGSSICRMPSGPTFSKIRSTFKKNSHIFETTLFGRGLQEHQVSTHQSTNTQTTHPVPQTSAPTNNTIEHKEEYTPRRCRRGTDRARLDPYRSGSQHYVAVTCGRPAHSDGESHDQCAYTRRFNMGDKAERHMLLR